MVDALDIERRNFETKVACLLTGLYDEAVVGDITTMASHYFDCKRRNPAYIPVPSSLHGATAAREMSDTSVEYPISRVGTTLPWMLGVYDGKRIKGPLNHVLARMLTVPRMIWGYIENYPRPDELPIYTDPPLLQFSQDELIAIYSRWFEQADDKLRGNPSELLDRFRRLGDVGEDVAAVERVYPAQNSTEAYELFGIFHLFPSNRTVDITSTSPGVILPTEADPLRFKDSVVTLKKNLLRPTYFEMLRRSIDVAGGKKRRYSASEKGTAKNLQAYPQLLDAAKDILERYLMLGDQFEIRLCQQGDVTKQATLIGDTGVVYSVRDEQQKDKIAHNVTVMDADEARKHRAAFEEEWAKGVPITDVAILDELMQKK